MSWRDSRHGSRGSPPDGWRARLASFLLALVFLGVNHAYTPIHLLAEDHLHGHDDRSAACARAPLRTSLDGGPQSTHEPHPASDHSLTSGIPRTSAQLDLFARPEALRLVAPLDPEPRTCPAPVPLLRPRSPPLSSSCRPRAPPAS